MSWVPVDTLKFTGPVSPVSAGSQLQNGLYDISGGIWSITGSGDLSSLQATSPKNNGLLLLESAGQAVNQRLKVDIIVGDPTKTATFVVLRSDGKTSGSTEYEVSASYNGISYFMVLAGAAANASTTAYTRSLVAGEVITLDVSCIQTNSTTTTIMSTVTDAHGAVLATSVITDTTAGMQNTSGYAGMFMNEGVPSGTAASSLVSTVYTFSYAAASQQGGSRARSSTMLDTGIFGGGPWVSKQELSQGLNAPNGVAGLNASGAITAPIASGLPVINMSASSMTSIPVPTEGNMAVIITASDPAQLQFSGTFTGETVQEVTLIVIGNGISVLFPTTNVSPVSSDVPAQADTTVGRYTAITYRFVPGVPVIQGGV